MEPTAQTSTAPKRTRADVYRARVEIRLAANGAGEQIAEVLKDNGVELHEAKWDAIFPHWLIACDRDAPEGDEVIGCLQVLPSKPIAYCEYLFVRRSVSFKLQVIALRKLIAQGMETGKLAGASYIGGFVDAKNQKFFDVMTKLKFTPVEPGVTMVRRLRD